MSEVLPPGWLVIGSRDSQREAGERGPRESRDLSGNGSVLGGTLSLYNLTG